MLLYVRWKILRNGRPIFLSNERKWINIPEGDYCVDGYANWGFGGDGNYSGKVDKHSVMLICPSKNVTGGEFVRTTDLFVCTAS